MRFLGMLGDEPLYGFSRCEFPRIGRSLMRFLGMNAAGIPIYGLGCCQHESSSGSSGSSDYSGSSGSSYGVSGDTGSASGGRVALDRAVRRRGRAATARREAAAAGDQTEVAAGRSLARRARAAVQAQANNRAVLVRVAAAQVAMEVPATAAGRAMAGAQAMEGARRTSSSGGSSSSAIFAVEF